MTYYVCLYHLVWATKSRKPLITVQIRSIILTAIHDQATKLKSHIIAINTMPDHIHIAVSIPPSVAVAVWVKHAKGVSSYAVNKTLPHLDPRFYWQTGYGALTFGSRQSNFIRDYIQDQVEHHKARTVYKIMELTGDE